MSEELSDEGQSFPVEHVEDKYLKLIWSGALFFIIGLAAMLGAFLYMSYTGQYKKDYQTMSQVLPFLLVFIPVYGYKILAQGLQERKLYRESEFEDLYMTDLGLAAPIILLEGKTRDTLREKKESDFQILWSDIDQFIVEPIRGSKKYSSPTYYKITLKNKANPRDTAFFILRDYFASQESKILDYVRLNLAPEQIILNDEIRKSET